MSEFLVLWWAQQLTLCGWDIASDPRQAIGAGAASERLRGMGINDRDEFSWRLWEGVAETRDVYPARLDALELLALGSILGWTRAATDETWLRFLARDITTQAPTLRAWIDGLMRSGLVETNAPGQALLTRERQQRGVSWAKLRHELTAIDAAKPASTDLWCVGPWRARAAIAPVLVWPFECSSDEQQQRRALLHEQGEVLGRDDLLALLFWLGSQGHRYGWQMDAARIAGQDPQARLEWLATLNDQQAYGRLLLQFLDDDEPLEWAAWDWLRLLDQAYLGHAAGWLSPSEAEMFAAHAVDLLQRRYVDWEAVARAYQRGRSLFEGKDLRGAFVLDWASLLNADTSPWKLPLADILDASQRRAARAFIERQRDSADAWVLAIASVRDPDLVHRRSLNEPLDQARIQDAERYLGEVLGLHRSEGIAGLARFWMPAQAHHLNQLAADARHPTAFGRAARAPRQLAACADHAATIAMAEKYAFYLVMAADSGRYAPEETDALARSLRDVLSRFYTDPAQMLAAWHAWEGVLSQDEAPQETSLQHDIAWHLGDPGSPFHWLSPSHSVTWQEPGIRPTLTRFTAISLAGPLNEALWQAPQSLAPEEKASLGEWLENQYALQGSSGLADFLDYLIEAGDRQDYQINYAPYTLNRARLEAEIAILETGDCAEEERIHLLRLKHVRDNDCHCNDQDMAAWDIAQLVDLSLAGRQLDWLDERRLAHYLDAAMALAKRHYSSWQDYAEGLYSGFGFFMDDTPERETFLTRFREALTAWLDASPLLAGAWASLDFPNSAMTHWTSLHVDILPGEPGRLH